MKTASGEFALFDGTEILVFELDGGNCEAVRADGGTLTEWQAQEVGRYLRQEGRVE